MTRNLQPFSGRLPFARIHAHVGVRILPERKPARSFIELKRRNPEIEKNAIEVAVRQRSEIVEVEIDKTKGLGKFLAQCSRAFLRRRIAIERGHMRAGLQDGAGVAAAPKRAIDKPLALRAARNTRAPRAP